MSFAAQSLTTRIITILYERWRQGVEWMDGRASMVLGAIAPGRQ